MGGYVQGRWQGNPSGATRAERSSCNFSAYVPDFLVGGPLELPAEVAADLAALEATTRSKLGTIRAKSATDLLVSALPSIPVFSITTAAAHIGRTFQATSDAVSRLLEADAIRQVNIGRRNRAFEAVGLFEAFTGFERSLASPAGPSNG